MNLIVSLFFYCFIYFISNFQLFKKLGIDWWKVFIPVYNDYLLGKYLDFGICLKSLYIIVDIFCIILIAVILNYCSIYFALYLVFAVVNMFLILICYFGNFNYEKTKDFFFE